MSRILPPLSFIACCFLFFTGCKQDAPGEQPEFNIERPLKAIIVNLDGEPDRLNPITTTSKYATQITDQIFSYLLVTHPQTLEFIPQLAKSRAEVEEINSGPYAGGLAYTFEIHEQAVWDNGQPVTAGDFIFTMKAALHPGVPALRVRPYLGFIRDITTDADNPGKFTVFTDEKYILGEEAIANAIPVIPEYVYDPEGLMRDVAFSDFTDPDKIADLVESDEKLRQFADSFSSSQHAREKGFISGSGPYRFEEWETGQRVVISKKENWWGDALAGSYPALEAFPEKLIYKPIPNAATALAALKAGEIDVLSNINPKDFIDVRETEFVKSRYEFHTPLALAYYFIYVNTENPKLADKRVRQALAHSINMDEIIETIYSGFGRRTASPVLPSADYYNDGLNPREFDTEKAIRLMQEAGWTDSNNNGVVDKEIDGEIVEMELSYLITANREISRNVGLLIKDNAKRAGFNIELVAKEFTVIIGELKKKNYELSSGGRALSATLWDPKQNWHSDGDNRTGFGDAQTDELIDRIRITLDKTQRDKLYKDLQAIIYDEQPEIFILVPTGRVAIQKRFEAETSPLMPGFSPNQFRLKEN